MTTTAERVARGAAFLDEKMPGWDQRIDLDKLDLAAPCRCVLGQLATDLDEGHDDVWLAIVSHFGLSLHSPYRKADGTTDAALGFNTDDLQWPPDYSDLTAEWRRLIEARRSA